MRGRDFLELAKELLPRLLPRHWRASIIHAYYGLLLECRDTMDRWKLPSLTRLQVHSQIRLRLVYANDRDLKQLGYTLEELGKHRNRANYDLYPFPDLSSGRLAVNAVNSATVHLALLDSIDRDPVRRAAAIASMRPCVRAAGGLAVRFVPRADGFSLQRAGEDSVFGEILGQGAD